MRLSHVVDSVTPATSTFKRVKPQFNMNFLWRI